VTKKEFAQEKARVRRLFRRWIDRMGYWSGWDFTFTYTDTAWEPTENPNELVEMEITSSAMYQYAHIVINCEVTAKRTDADLELTIVHELQHPILEAMHHWRADDHFAEEYAATILARRFIHTFEAGKKSERKKGSATASTTPA
jgi:hypothetical protein